MPTARSVFAALTVLAALLAVGVGPAQATTVPFKGTLSLSTTGCNSGVILCGTGVLAQFGAASFEVTSRSVRPVPPCVETTSVATVAVEGGTITSTSITLGCSPGSSDVLLTSGTFVITGGTGAFAGASGGGTLRSSVPHLSSAPLSIRTQLLGELTLP